MPRVVIIGLDCMTPQLTFGTFASSLPNIAQIVSEGMGERLESCIPPITVPAWSCMMTGADPGELGIYGFRNRASWSYDDRRVASSMQVRIPTLWSVLTRYGRRSRVIGVPQTYPAKPLAGSLVTGPLTPPDATEFSYPPELSAEIARILPGYKFDVANFRQLKPMELVSAVREMTERRFNLVRSWIARSDWELLVAVEIGLDRVHHALLHHVDEDHPRYDPDSHLGDEVLHYYQLLDRLVGELRDSLEPDDLLIIASDHGARANHGALALNDWLIAHGYLRMLERPSRGAPLDSRQVDWRHTRAWADGGYVGRIYFNLIGREPAGVVSAQNADALGREIQEQLSLTRTLEGDLLRAQALRPKEVYRETQGHPPDLILILDELRFRAAGTIGHDDYWLSENDRGPDSANHAMHGVLILNRCVATRTGLPTLFDIAPTALAHLGIAVPARMRGRALFEEKLSRTK